MSSKRRWLLVSAIIVILIIVAGLWWWKSNESIMLAKADDIRGDLLKVIPPGSDIAKAEEILKGKGYQCSHVTTTSGWYVQGEAKVSAWPVYRRINAKALQTDGKLTDIQVFTDITGP